MRSILCAGNDHFRGGKLKTQHSGTWLQSVAMDRLVTARRSPRLLWASWAQGPGVPRGPRWLAFLTLQPSHSYCSSQALWTACPCFLLQWAVLSSRSCSSKELEQKQREGCEGSWEAETELGHFKVHYREELVFILRRPFTNFRLPDLLEPLIQMHEMEDEPKGENLKPSLPPTPAPRFTKKNLAWFFFLIQSR